jgi:aminomethyltransferase
MPEYPRSESPSTQMTDTQFIWGDVINRITPYELGIDHCINLEKETDYMGKQALLAEHASGAKRALVGIEIDLEDVVQRFLDNDLAPDVSQRVRWDKLAVRSNDTQIGKASSITWSPTSKRLIGFSCIDKAYAKLQSELVVEWKDFWGKSLGDVNAKVVEMPFIDLKRV